MDIEGWQFLTIKMATSCSSTQKVQVFQGDISQYHSPMNYSRQIHVYLETKGISHAFLVNKYFIGTLPTYKGSVGRQALVFSEGTQLKI